MRFAFFIVLLTGCSSIQVVQQTPAGGVVGLHGPTESARAKAEEHMRAHCPYGYRIVREGDDGIAYSCKTPTTPTSAPRESDIRI